jgi:hypothetical protein
VTTNQHGKQVYRQARFYRRTRAGWQRTVPHERLWGPPASLESTYFVLHYHQRDAEAVAKVAPQIDALYITLSDNFGVPRLSPAAKLPIEVNVILPLGSAWLSLEHPLRILSPTLYLAPDELTDDQLLAQSISVRLLNYVLGQANVLPTCQPMLDGLRLWQMWDLRLPLSVWQDEVVAWVYIDAADAQAGQPLVLPEWHLPLCAIHSLWMDSPTQLQIPILCDSAIRRDWDTILPYLRSSPCIWMSWVCQSFGRWSTRHCRRLCRGQVILGKLLRSQR